jgi:hypothetical protein
LPEHLAFRFTASQKAQEQVVELEDDRAVLRGFKTPVRLENASFPGMNQSFETPHGRGGTARRAFHREAAAVPAMKPG